MKPNLTKYGSFVINPIIIIIIIIIITPLSLTKIQFNSIL